MRVSWEDAFRTFRFEQFEEKVDGRHTIIITGNGPHRRADRGGRAPSAFQGAEDAEAQAPVCRAARRVRRPGAADTARTAGASDRRCRRRSAGSGDRRSGLGVPTAPEAVAATREKAPERLDISVAMGPSLWLNVSALPPVVPSAMWPMILTGVLAVVLVAIAAVWAAGRVARPIAGLTAAAERLGRGDALFLAPEEGPQDVRAAASAFNTMAARLRRLIEDQRALLSAVGHDLRTPIASLRIRTELIKDPELAKPDAEFVERDGAADGSGAGCGARRRKRRADAACRSAVADRSGVRRHGRHGKSGLVLDVAGRARRRARERASAGAAQSDRERRALRRAGARVDDGRRRTMSRSASTTTGPAFPRTSSPT